MITPMLPCPACRAGAWAQLPESGGEPVAKCRGCGCVYDVHERKLWHNLTEAVTDPQPNDDWAGAAGAEVRDLHYEPYPHQWDYDLRWCRVRAAIDSGLFHEITQAEGRDALDIPCWIIRRALVALPSGYHQPDIF
jgi:hypothetical protein